MPIKPKPLPPASTLRQNFRYEPETGRIFNLVSRTTRRAGTRAEHLAKNGYLQVYVAGHLRAAHRIAWVMHYGNEPDDCIDHINGNPSDNRISNLRVASHWRNMCNRERPSHNTSGIKGVSRHHKGWRAYITVDGARQNLGTFGSLAEAGSVVRAARAELHGEFAKG